MPQIFGGSLSPRMDLMMQLATVGPVLPDPVLNTYGAAVLLTSPRANGGIVPLAIRAAITLQLGAVTLRIRPTWSDGSVGAGLLWDMSGGVSTDYQAGILVIPLNNTIVAPPPAPAGAWECWDSTIDLTAFWKNGVTLQQLAFDCQSDQNADTASLTITHFGLYT